MDAKIENGDIALRPNGDYEMIGGLDEAVQHVRTVALISRGDFVYHRGLGVDYNAFAPDADNAADQLDMLIKEAVADLCGVDAQVLSYDAENALAVIKVTFRGKSAVTEVDISGII